MAHVSIAPVMRLRDYLRREEPAILFKQTLTSPGYVRMNACTRHQRTTITQLHHGWNLPVPRIQSRNRHTCRTPCLLRPPTSDPITPLHDITCTDQTWGAAKGLHSNNPQLPPPPSASASLARSESNSTRVSAYNRVGDGIRVRVRVMVNSISGVAIAHQSKYQANTNLIKSRAGAPS